MNLLAKSCFAPGLISMVSNLIASAGEIKPLDDTLWMKEYMTGKGHEIYRVKIDASKYPDELSFCSLAETSYQEYSAIVFALEVVSKAEPTKASIRLNPAKFIFQKADHQYFDFHLYIICEDGDQAQKISELEMADEKFERYFGKSRERLMEEAANKIPNGTMRGDLGPEISVASMKGSIGAGKDAVDLGQSEKKSHLSKAADFTGMEEVEEA